MTHWLKKISEALVLAIACLTPWAFGSVDAWAGFGLGIAILVLTVLTTASTWNCDRSRHLWCVPSLALAGLVLLGLIQAATLPAPLVRALAPSEAALRSTLAPSRPERVAGDNGPPVALPPLSLSQNPETTRSAICRLAGAWLLFQAVLSLDDPRSAFRRFGVATAINAGLLSLFSVIQWLSWNGKVMWVREAPRPESPWYSGGPFASHNHLAAYLNVGLGFLLGLLLSSGQGNPWFAKRGARLWPAYGVGVVIVGLFASHSRGGVVAAAAAALTIVFASILRGSRRPRTSRVVSEGSLKSGMGLLAVVSVMVVLALLMTGNQSPLARVAALSEAGSDIRWVVWDLALPAWWDRPVWGAGLGCFTSAITPYEREDHGYTFSRAENEYLDILVEGGAVGLALALIALGGCILLARRTFATTPLKYERTLILGGAFGGLALIYHWLCDFSFHIPAVAVSAIVLGGFLCRIGLDAGSSLGPASPIRRGASRLAGLTLPVLGLLFLRPGYDQARAELCLWNAGLTLPDSARGEDAWEERETAEVEQGVASLRRALEARPDWAGGHLRLGTAYLRLYELKAAELVGSEVADPEQVAVLSQPLWLRDQVHDGKPGLSLPVESLIEQEPIRTCLVPAARSFLEARRCSPVLAVPHIELASLDYLLDANEPGTVAIGRALGLAGANRRVVELAALLAVQVGDVALAARCWHRTLEIDDESWQPVAHAAGGLLTPDLILRDVLPEDGGRLAFQFAQMLYETPETRTSRTRFLQAALERLPDDPRLTTAARLYYQGLVQLELGHGVEGRGLIEEALLLEPMERTWRQTLVDLLINEKQWRTARLQIAVGLELYPGDQDLLKAHQRVVDALARGDPASSREPKVRDRMTASAGGS